MAVVKKAMAAGAKAGKKVLATDAGQSVVGTVVDKVEEIVVDKADDVAGTVKARAAKAGGRSPRKPTGRKKTTARKKTPLEDHGPEEDGRPEVAGAEEDDGAQDHGPEEDGRPEVAGAEEDDGAEAIGPEDRRSEVSDPEEDHGAHDHGPEENVGEEALAVDGRPGTSPKEPAKVIRSAIHAFPDDDPLVEWRADACMNLVR